MSLVFPQIDVTDTIGGGGLSSRKPVRVATVIAGTLATAFADGQTIDGVTITTGDRCLIKNQTNQVQNGVYIVQVSGAPFRATDYDDGDTVASSFVYVQEGDVNGTTGWLCTNLSGADIIGTSNITFKLISGDVSTTGVSTDNAIVRWDGITGTKIQNSTLIIDDTGNLTGLQYLQFNDITAPTNPASGQGRLYKKTGDDGIWWRPDAAGPEVDLTAVGGGGSLSNEGGGAQVYDTGTGALRTLVGTSNGLIVSQGSTTITIDNTLSGANLGAGSQLFSAKIGSALNFRSLTAGVGVSLTQNTNDIAIAGTGLVNVQDEGGVLAGTPHTTLNFVGTGVTATNAGGGVATITIPGAGIAQLFSAYNDVGGIVVPTSYVDVPLLTETKKTSSFTHVASSAEVTITETGSYVFSGHATAVHTAGSHASILLHLVRDTGGGYVEVPGTIVGSFINNSADENATATFTIAFDVTSGDKFKLQVEKPVGGGDVETIASSCLTIWTSGTKGDTGPTGSGSNIIVRDEGAVIAGTPHSILNFTGSLVTASDAGGGVANITLATPLTTKGDIYVYGTGTEARLPVGTNDQALIADSAQSNGLRWTEIVNSLTTNTGLSANVAATGAVTVTNTGVLTNIAGTGISVSGATGNVTIANTGVLSWSGGTTGLTPAVATSGAVTLAGTLIAVAGGTGFSSYAVGDLLYANTATTLAKLSDVVTGNVLLSGGVGVAPVWGKVSLTTAVSGILPVANGGTELSTAPANGQLLIGNGTTYTLATLTAGTAIDITDAAGSITVNNTGVTSLTTNTGLSTNATATGNVTITNTGVLSWSGGTTGLTPAVATTGAVTLAGTLVVSNGGTGVTTLATNGVIFGNGTSAVGVTAAAVTGEVLVGTTGAAPSWSALSGLAVTALTGTANQVTASASVGAVTISTPSVFIAPGSIAATTTLASGTLLIDGTSTVVAAGTTQAGATLLTTTYNVVTSVTVGNTGVRLPTPAIGTDIKIVNKGALALSIYPATGGTIDSAGVNSAITLPVDSAIELEALTSTQWYTIVPAIIGGTRTIVSYGNGATTIAAESVLTTKGDLWGYDTTDARVPVGADNYLLTADSTQAPGLRWAQNITPAQLPFGVVNDTIAADTNNYNPVGLSTAIQLRLTPSGATRSITGLVISGSAGAPNLSELKITNVGTQFNLILRAESASSTAANRFVFDGQDMVLLPGQNCTVWYDWTSARWRGVACSQDGRLGGQHATAGIITPAAISTAEDNYAPTGLENATVLRLTATAVASITGLTGGYDGRRIVMINIGALPITLANQSISSLAANRFFTGTSDTTIVGNNSASLIYDGISGFWRVYAGTGGAITGAGGLIQSNWVEVVVDRVTTSTSWTVYSSTINAATTLPVGTITVLTTGTTAATPTLPGSPAALAATIANPQTLIIQSTTNDAQIVTYTGSTGNTFTGCTGGSGALAVGNYVWNGPVQTSINAGSNGAILPQGTINVVATTGFPASGIILVSTTNGNQRVTYTGTTATTFTGCVGGTGAMSTGGMIYDVGTVNPHDVLTIHVTTSGGALIIIATANASTDSNRTGYLHVLVDGFFRRGSSTQGNGGAPAGSAVVSLKLSNVPAGDHIVTMRWVTEGGTFAIRPVTRPQDNNASLLVQEVSS